MKYVIISLDCELGWGFADLDPTVPKWRAVYDDPSHGRDIYRFLLDTFDEYGVPVTWAIVGHLFCRECSPGAHHENDHIAAVDPYADREAKPLFYGNDLVEAVRDTDVDHEIAGHSYSHPEFPSLSQAEAREELAAMVDAAAGHGVDLRSFVYPRGLRAHIDLLTEFDIEVYRGPQAGEVHTLKSGAVPFFSRDPQFFSAPPVTPGRDENGLVRVPSSRLLKDERWWWLQPRRVGNALDNAADGELVHLTFHPHDLISHPRLRSTLRRILDRIDAERAAGNLEPLTMGETPQIA